MTDAATVDATARVSQLLDLTERLTARLVTETEIYETRRPQDAALRMVETQELANAYRREAAQVKADPTILAPAPATMRLSLIEATKTFEDILSIHARAVDAARIVSEGLVRTIAAEIADQRGSPSAYGVTGRAHPGDDCPIAFNSKA